MIFSFTGIESVDWIGVGIMAGITLEIGRRIAAWFLEQVF